jgi:hypothetical protein
MPERLPKPISATQRRVRLQSVRRIARGLGFVGRVEYRHVSTDSGGAQYGNGPTAAEDLLTVYAKAFERDADPEDFSIEAILAHERGHQLLLRHPRLSRLVLHGSGLASEEVLASIVGSLLTERKNDQDDLMSKAIVEATNLGMRSERAFRVLMDLRDQLEQILLMGNKTLREIKQDLLKAFARDGLNAVEWLDAEVQNRKLEPKPDLDAIGFLERLRNALAEEAKRLPATRRQSRAQSQTKRARSAK